MKTATLLLVVLTAAIGCSKDKAKPTTPKQPDTTATAPKPDDKPAPPIGGDQQVSPGLAVSPDIAAACNLKVSADVVNPTFDYDKDELLASDRAILDQIATCLSTGALKGRKVQLVGRADPRGTEEYNLGLGSKRANSVGQYLGRLGVAAAQLAETSRGALDASGTDEAGWKKDRRVDIVLVTNAEG